MKRTLSLFLSLLMLLSVFPLTSLALSWDGSSAGGSTNAVNGNNTGYVIRSTKDDEAGVGYRFSVVNAAGNNKVGKVIDVFRKTTNGTNAYTSSAKFTTKYNKKQLIANKDGKMTTTKNTTNCYKEANLKFLTALPNPSGVETWQAYEQNINQVLTTLGVGTVANMVYGDKVLIEPLFDTCLAGEYQALTVTEIAYCGRSVLGGSSDGGTSNGTSSTWGFIANYTNRIWPNKLFTPDGQGLWTAASTIASSKKASFNVILGRGYGVGIAYNETQNLTYTIAFNGNGNTGGSTASMTMAKDESKKLTANGFTKTGNSFTGWNTNANGSGTSYTNKQSVKNLSSTHGATVALYAQWTPYVLKVYFNANGGTPSNTTSNGTTYYNKVVSSSNQNMIHSSSKNETAAFYQTFRYNTAKDFANASSFGLARTGYTFAGWNTNASGTGTTYDQTTEYLPTKLASNLSSGDRTLTLYAKWMPVTYTVSYNANGGSGAPGNQTKTYGVDLTLSSGKPTRTGYTFNGWNTNSSGTGTNYDSGGKYTGNAALTLYAKWMPNTYTVTYNANGGSGAPGSQTKTHGVNLTLSSTKPTRTGYTFVNWNTASNGTGTSYASGGAYSGNANLTLYAQWTPNTYTVTYNANGGSGAPGSQTKTHGVNLTLSSTKPTRTGYTFASWNTSSAGYGTTYSPGSTYSGNANLTLYAQWTPNTYTVTYNANGGSGAPGNQTKTHDVNLTLSGTKPTRSGYTFASWNTNASGTGTTYASGSTYTSNANLTLYAQWTPNNYTIVFDGNGATGGSTASMSMKSDESKNLTANGFYKTGHSFKNWNTQANGNGTSYADQQSVKNLAVNGSGTVTLYAQWTLDTYKVHYDANGGTGAPGDQTKTYGVSLTLSATKPTRTGYTFQNWNTKADGSGTTYASGALYTANAALTLYAQWKINTYTVSYNANGGAGAPGSQTKTYGVDLTLSSATPSRTGYSFKNWNTAANGSGTGYAPGSIYTGNANLTLYAQWTPVTYTVTYNANGGTGAPANQTKTHDIGLTLSSVKPTRTGYSFVSWNTQVNGSGTTYVSGAVYKGNTALTLYAQWTPIQYTILFDGNGHTAGSTASMTMQYNESKPLTENGFIKTNHRFTGWNTRADGTGMDYADKQTVQNLSAVDGTTITLYAQWVEGRLLRLEAIAPNAPYREGTDVISSFHLINEGTGDCVPSDHVSVRFHVYEDDTIIKTVELSDVVVPASEQNLLYFKWPVPTGLSDKLISISGEIIDNGSSYGAIRYAYTTCAYVVSSTPDTQYEASAPVDFEAPEELPTVYSDSKTWSIWTYEAAGFHKRDYGIGYADNMPQITPDLTANATQEDGVWTMKSGYGITLALDNGVRSLSGYTMPALDAYTLPQYAEAFFPEYGYLHGADQYRTLELSGNVWRFRQNASYGYVHFTPLWYPDGSYTISVRQSDLWTPAGMLQRQTNTNTITIRGSAYDDWYIH